MKLKMRKLQKTPCFWPAVAIGSLLLQWFGRGTFLMWAMVPILAYAVWRSIKLDSRAIARAIHTANHSRPKATRRNWARNARSAAATARSATPPPQ